MLSSRHAPAALSLVDSLLLVFGVQMSSMSDAEIIDVANKLEEQANSVHPLPGFWDGMGNPVYKEEDQVMSKPATEDQSNSPPAADAEQQRRQGSQSQELSGAAFTNAAAQLSRAIGKNVAETEKMIQAKSVQLREQAQALRQMGP